MRLNKRGAGDNTIVYVVLIGLVVVLALGGLLQKNYNIFSISGNEQISRSVPSSATAGQQFNITYTASGTSGTWGASIEENISGGCVFVSSNGNSMRTVLLSDNGNTQVVYVLAPTSGSCSITGDYEFGTSPIQTLQTQTVQINSLSVSNNYQNNPLSNSTLILNSSSQSSGDFLSNTIFSLGSFNVTGMILVIALAVILLLLLIGGKKR